MKPKHILKSYLGKFNLFLLGLFLGLICMWLPVHIWNQKYIRQIEYTHTAELAKTQRNSSLTNILKYVLEQIDNEIKLDPSNKISNETIDRIAVLSYAFQSYRSMKDTNVQHQQVIPELGEMLLFLINTPMDSSSWQQILRQASFAYAGLKGANLKNADLRGAMLNGVDLRNADLRNARLDGASLRNSRLHGTLLNGSSMISTDFTRSDLSWSEIIDAKCHRSIFNGSLMMAAKLMGSDLTEADLQWVNLSTAIISGADLRQANMFRTNFKGSQLDHTLLNNAKMSFANLCGANLSTSDLSNTDLTGAVVYESDWLERLNEWEVAGANTIKNTYTLGIENATHPMLYKLQKKAN